MADLPAPQPAALIAPAGAERLVEAFLRGRKPSTLRAYRADLCQLADFMGVGTPEAAASRLVAGTQGEGNSLALAWRDHLLGQGLASDTINRRLAAMRSMVKLARLMGIVSWTIDVEGVPHERRRDVSGPGIPAIKAMAATLTGARDRAIFALLVQLALRRSEVVSLDLEHVRFESSELLVLRKRRRERKVVDMPEGVVEALRTWVRERGLEPGPLFPGDGRSDRMSDRTVHKIVSAAARKAGLKAWPHGLRHSVITFVANKKGLPAAQALADHASIATTGRYLDEKRDAAKAAAQAVDDLF